MTTKLSAAELARAVTAVAGVRGLEPGIGSALKTVGSHLRSGNPATARFGVIIEADGQKIILEIGLDGSRPVKEIVRDVQQAVLRSLPQQDAAESPSREHSAAVPQVKVRVQSIL